MWYSILALAILLGLFCFNPWLLFFQNDDFIHIPLSRDGVWLQRNTFRPVCDLSIALDYWLWQKNAVGYHFTNLLLHVANTLCIFWLVKLLAELYQWQQPKWLIATIPVLFFVYAFHSEAIFWILGRSATLGSLFFLLSVCFFVKARLNRNVSVIKLLASIVFGLIAWLTYESTWILLPVFLILLGFDKWQKKFIQKSLWIFIGVVLLLFISYLFVRKQYTGEIAGSYDAGAFLRFDFALLALNYSKLIGRLFVPPTTSTTTFSILFLFVVFIIIVQSFIVFKKDKSILITVVLLMIAPLPYCSFGANTHTVEAERYLYLPSVFGVILLLQILAYFKWKNFVTLALIAFHLFYLFQSATSFQTAGNIVAASLKAIEASKSKQRLFIYHLPQHVNGALVFRTGFEQAVLWSDSANQNKEVVVVSLAETDQGWTKAYSFSMSDWEKPMLIDSVYESVNGQTTEYVKKKFEGRPYSPLTDAILLYTNKSISVSR
jgi:hypothetical protein